MSANFVINNIVGIIGIITAIAIAVVSYIKNRTKKELSYSVLSSTSLLIKDEALKNRMKLLLDGVEVKGEVHLVLIKLANTGNVPIKPTEFTEDLKIISRGAIIVAEVKETNPANLKIKIDNAIGDVLGTTSVKPMLLNPKDEIIFKLLVNNYKNDIELSSRIVGVQKILKSKRKFPLSATVLSLGAILLLQILSKFEIDNEMTTFYGIGSSILTAMVISATIFWITEWYKWKKNLS
ncbi:hypothetical protein [Mesobacillus harenae]|uniref:hypothetical protein n=1 Tax=Mesobacillus harenae TaxID=2213203 RepID=UPI00157FE790|nr:hypothetical protein [Mesobacillus harenae]